MKKEAIKNSDQLKVDRRSGEIYSHIRKKWLVETPEKKPPGSVIIIATL